MDWTQFKIQDDLEANLDPTVRFHISRCSAYFLGHLLIYTTIGTFLIPTLNVHPSSLQIASRLGLSVRHPFITIEVFLTPVLLWLSIAKLITDRDMYELIQFAVCLSLILARCLYKGLKHGFSD
jgi:hypothetical protein